MAVLVNFDKAGVGVVLLRLAHSSHEGASALYARVMAGWGQRIDRQRMTLKVNSDELDVLRGLDLPGHIRDLGMLQCGWVVTYRHPKKPELEVVVHSTSKPPKRRAFKMPGGTVRLTAVSVDKIEQEAAMATKSRRAKKNTKAVDEDELDELDALEELDEDLEDEEEPDEVDEDEDLDDEDEDEDDEEEEAPKSRRRAPAKKAPAKKTSRRKAPVEDDEDDEDDEDEDEPPAKKRTAAKSAKKPAAKKKAAPQTRALPEGKLGPKDIADEAGVDERTVRIFLRGHEDEFPKPEGSFRYYFGKKDAARLVRAIKKERA